MVGLFFMVMLQIGCPTRFGFFLNQLFGTAMSFRSKVKMLRRSLTGKTPRLSRLKSHSSPQECCFRYWPFFTLCEPSDASYDLQLLNSFSLDKFMRWAMIVLSGFYWGASCCGSCLHAWCNEQPWRWSKQDQSPGELSPLHFLFQH